MGGEAPAAAAPDNAIPFLAPAADPGLWPQVQAALFREDPNLYRAWFAALTEGPGDPETLRLTRLAAQVQPGIARFEILGPAG